MDLMITTMATGFWGTGIGGIVKALLAAVGIIVVLAAVVKSIGDFVGGKMGKGVQKIVGGLIIGAFCIKPELFDTLLTFTADLLTNGVDSTEKIVNEAPKA